MSYVFETEKGVNIKVVDEELCCIYGNENSSHYLLTRKDIECILTTFDLMTSRKNLQEMHNKSAEIINKKLKEGKI